MNPDFYSKMSIVNHERGVIPSSVKFSVQKHENFPPQLRRRKRWVKNWKNVSDQKNILPTRDKRRIVI